MVNADRSGNSIEMGAFAVQKHEPNGSLEPSLCPKTSEIGSRVYKLIIQIEKVKPKPCPKSKKFGFQLETMPETIPETMPETKKQEEVSASLPIVSTEQKSGLSKKQSAVCLICNETFQSAQSLYLHKKKHHRFVCQICDAYCSTRVICDRHERLHVSDDPNFPHKCHLCAQKFDSKRNVRVHTRVMHSFVAPNIGKSVNATSKDNTLRLRSSHVKQIAQPTEKIVDTESKEKSNSRRNDGGNRGASNYGAVTFTCRVCCQDFTTVEAAETHTREHLELVEKEHKCNICKKLFKNEMTLNAHLAEHLSRALRCPMCPKAFINRATLRIHMKSHGLDK